MPCYFIVNVSSVYKMYLIGYVPTYLVETDKEQLNYEIEEELKKEYDSFFFRKFQFSYITLEAGELEVTHINSLENYSGTFSITDNLMKLDFNGNNYVFEISNSNVLSWENDLTDYYRGLYPEREINRICVILTPIGISE